MSELTPNLNLFKYDTNSDSSQAFSISNALNPNWDIIDNAFSQIRAVKGYEENGNILTDPVGLAYVKKYAHSTFDLDKFIVVGSSIITNDGIASGFETSHTNYINVPNTYNFSTSNSFELGIGFILTSSTATKGFLYRVAIDSYLGTFGFAIGIENNKVVVSGMTSETFTIDYTLSLNTYYILKVKCNNGTCGIYIDNDLIGLQFTYIKDISSAYITIGNGTGTNSNPFNFGSIDLKQFSITVDGVEVFSGNKTGTDYYEKDTYTLSPNNNKIQIIDTGIVTNFKSVSASILDTGIVMDYTKSFSFYVPFLCTYGNKDNQALINLCGYRDYYNTLRIQCDNRSHFSIRFYKNTTKTESLKVSSSSTLSYNKWYLLCFSWDGTNYICKIKRLFTTEFTNLFTYADSTPVVTAFDDTVSHTVSFGDRYSHWYLNGFLDLKYLKIYSQDNLIYSPYAEIPYTCSLSGEKIVDSTYRTILQELYVQGKLYSAYYTLDETNNNYTLPYGDSYGMLNKNKITIDMMSNGGL